MRLLLVDGMNNLYRSYFAYSRMTNNNKPVSCIYGFPMILESVIRRYKIDKVIVVWDGNKSKHRLRILPDYKGTRKGVGVDKEDLYSQRDTVMKILSYLGIPQVWNSKVEADDYLYALTRKYKSKYEVFILSTDKDFHQLLAKGVRIINTKLQVVLSRKNYAYHFGVDPNQSLDYLILVGDKSDNIRGYPGIGDKRAKDFLEKYSSIKKFLNTSEEHRNIDKHKLAEVYATNRLLISLPLFYKKFIKGKIGISYWDNLKTPTIDIKSLKRICNIFNIRTFLNPDFINTFKNVKSKEISDN